MAKIRRYEDERFRRELEYLITAKGITKEQFAHDLDVPVNTVYRWLSGENFPTRYGRQIKRYFGLDYEQARILFGSRVSTVKLEDSYELFSFFDLKQYGRTGTWINQQTEIIIDEFEIPEDEGNDFGDSAKWARLMDLSPETGKALFYGPRMVGYWFFVAVDDKTFNEVLDGENVNKSIDVENVITLGDVAGDYQAYLVDMFLLDDHRTAKNRARLATAFFDQIYNFAENGIYFSSIASNITTSLANSAARGAGMKFVCDHKHHHVEDEFGVTGPSQTMIRAVDLTAGEARMLKHDRRIWQKYSEHFGFS